MDKNQFIYVTDVVLLAGALFSLNPSLFIIYFCLSFLKMPFIFFLLLIKKLCAFFFGLLVIRDKSKKKIPRNVLLSNLLEKSILKCLQNKYKKNIHLCLGIESLM